MRPCAALLAGGKSTRMGSNKALLEVNGETAVRHLERKLQPLFFDLAILTSEGNVAESVGCAAVPDRYPGRGPLGGLHAALLHFGAPVFLVACDMPGVSVPFVGHMLELWDARDKGVQVLAPFHDGYFEPLHAIYAPELLPQIEGILAAGLQTPSFQKLLPRWGARAIEEVVLRSYSSDLAMFENRNTPAQP